MTVGRCFCYHEIEHLASPSYVPGTINAFNQHYCINFPQHVAHMRIFIRLAFLRRQTVIKKSCISVNKLKIIAYCNCKALLPVKQYKNVRNFSNFFTPKPEQKAKEKRQKFSTQKPEQNFTLSTALLSLDPQRNNQSNALDALLGEK